MVKKTCSRIQNCVGTVYESNIWKTPENAYVVYFTQIKEIWEQFLTYRVNTEGSSGTYFSSIGHPSKIVSHFAPEMRVTKLYWEMWDSSDVQTSLDSFCAGTKIIPDIGLLFTHKNGYFGARSEAATRRSLKWRVTLYRIRFHTAPDIFSCRHIVVNIVAPRKGI